MILLTVALCKRITPRKQVRCQRYLLYAYFWVPFWQFDDFTPYNHIPVTGMRVPRPLVWDLSLDKAPSRLNHVLVITAIKSLSQSVVLPVIQLRDAHIAFLMCCFTQIFRSCSCLLTPWDLVHASQSLGIWSKVSAAKQENRGNLCLWSNVKSLHSFY